MPEDIPTMTQILQFNLVRVYPLVKRPAFMQERLFIANERLDLARKRAKTSASTVARMGRYAESYR